MVEVYATKLEDGIRNNEIVYLTTFLDKEKQERIKRYRNWQDAQRTLIGDLLVRFVLMRKYKLLNEAIVFSQNEFGKPYLEEFQDVHFNISHSGEWVVVVIANEAVGIDIEKNRECNLEVARNSFTGREYISLLNTEKKDIDNYFFKLWSMKESYIKAIGKGVSLPLKSFEVRANLENHYVYGDERFLIKQYPFEKGYTLSVCYSTTERCRELEIISIGTIVEAFSKD